MIRITKYERDYRKPSKRFFQTLRHKIIYFCSVFVRVIFPGIPITFLWKNIWLPAPGSAFQVNLLILEVCRRPQKYRAVLGILFPIKKNNHYEDLHWQAAGKVFRQISGAVDSWRTIRVRELIHELQSTESIHLPTYLHVLSNGQNQQHKASCDGTRFTPL